MSDQPKEGPPQGVPQIPKVNVDDLINALPSAQPAGELAAGPNVTVLLSDVVATPLNTEYRTSSSGQEPVQFTADGVVMDEAAFNTALGNVNQRLIDAVTRGDAAEVERYLWYLEDQSGEDVDNFRQQLRDAVQRHDASQLVLDTFNVSLPNRGLAEKNLIKEAIEGKVGRLPFEFEDDAAGSIAASQTDFIYTQKGRENVLLVGSKKGIHGISVLTDNPDMYEPDLDSIERDTSTGTITIKLKPNKKGERPPVDKIIIFKDQKIDLPKELVKREEELEEEDRRHTPPPPSISSIPSRSPVATPRPMSQPRAVRPTTWVSTSH